MIRRFQPGEGLLCDCKALRNFREPSFEALLSSLHSTGELFKFAAARNQPRVDTNWTLVPLSVSTVHHFVELSCYGGGQRER